VEVKRTRGAVYNLNYHLVWCPKSCTEAWSGPGPAEVIGTRF